MLCRVVKFKHAVKSCTEVSYLSKSKTFPIGRDATTGRLIPVDKARRDPTHTVVERMPKRGPAESKRK
jgi:hypothetical protein